MTNPFSLKLYEVPVPPDFSEVGPYNHESEKNLIGGILVNNELYYKVADFLKPEDFIDPRHSKLYSLFQDHIDAGRLCNPVTLSSKITGFNLDEVGGNEYLAHLVVQTVNLLNIKEYGEIVKDLADRRRIIAIARDHIRKCCEDTDETSRQIVESIEQSLHDMSGSSEDKTGLEPIGNAVTEAIDHVKMTMALGEGEIAGVTTGLKALDRATGGLFSGDLIILAGRPAMGKTALAMNILKGAAKAGHFGAIFSLEMAKKDLGLRLISDMTHNDNAPLAYFDARQGNFSDYQFQRFKSGGERAAALPIEITDKSSASIGTIRLECLKLRRKLEKQGKRLDLVVIDYLQLMSVGDRYRGNRTNEITEISRSLKNMAKEFDCPFLVLSQLSRNLEHRDDKRPIMSDLRESGAIEQDADMVIFVYREHEYIKNKEPKDTSKFVEWQEKCERLEQQMEVIIAKQRSGPTGKHVLNFYKETSAVRG